MTDRTHFTPALRGVLLLILVYAALLTALALILPADTLAALFSESGPFERLSIAFWLLLAAWCFDLARPLRHNLVLTGLIALLFAAREADWHKAFTQDSLFKSDYYFDTPAPLAEKIPAAMVALGAFAVLIYALACGAKFLRRGRRAALREPWVQTMLLGTAMLPLLKVLDRLRSWLRHDFGIRVSEQLGNLTGALEEGFECLLPLIFAFALVQYRRQTDPLYLSLAMPPLQPAEGR